MLEGESECEESKTIDKGNHDPYQVCEEKICLQYTKEIGLFTLPSYAIIYINYY